MFYFVLYHAAENTANQNARKPFVIHFQSSTVFIVGLRVFRYDVLLNSYAKLSGDIHKQYSPFGAKIYSDICPRTLSVPRSEQ